MARGKETPARGGMRDKMRQRLEERKSENVGGGTLRLPDGIDFFNPEKGTYEIDHIPYIVSDSRNPDGIKAGEVWWRRIYWIHRNIGPEEKRVVCLKTIGKPCPICAEWSRLSKDKNVDKEVVDAIKPSERELYNVILDGKLHVFEMSSYLYGRPLDDELREVDEKFMDFPMLECGYTLKVRFKEKKLGKNAFIECDRVDFADRDALSEKWLDKAVDLDACLNIMTPEQLELMMFGAEPEDVDEDDIPEPPRRRTPAHDDDDAPPPSKSKEDPPWDEEPEQPRRRKPAPEPEADEEEPPARRRSAPEPEPEPEPETEKPARRRKSEPEPEADGEGCPHGLVWGKDNDTDDVCDKCKVWDACADEKDRLKREERGGRRKG